MRFESTLAMLNYHSICFALAPYAHRLILEIRTVLFYRSLSKMELTTVQDISKMSEMKTSNAFLFVIYAIIFYCDELDVMGRIFHVQNQILNWTYIFLGWGEIELLLNFPMEILMNKPVTWDRFVIISLKIHTSFHRLWNFHTCFRVCKTKNLIIQSIHHEYNCQNEVIPVFTFEGCLGVNRRNYSSTTTIWVIYLIQFQFNHAYPTPRTVMVFVGKIEISKLWFIFFERLLNKCW